MADLLFGWLFKPKRTAPPRVESDTVLPAHHFDDTWAFRHTGIAWTAQFDDVLDADKLQLAMAKLLEIDSWRKFGGRLRLNSNDKLEIHIPEAFTAKRPAFRFSHSVIQQSIDDHPVASQLPKPTNGPSLQPGSPTFHSFAFPPDAPKTLEDYIYSDEPQISVHVTSFTDATLVALSHPHVMTDMVGRRALVEAWCLVLAGRETEVPPVLGTTEDVMRGVGTSEHGESYVLADQSMGAFQRTRLLVRVAWNSIWTGCGEGRILFLPCWFMAHLRKEAERGMAEDFQEIAARATLSQKAFSGPLAPTEKPAFVSEGDILSAWITQMIMASESQPRPATVGNAFQIRGRMPSVFQPDGVYVQNLVFGSYALLSAQEIAAGSLGYIAARIRTFLNLQVTEPQIHALVRETRASKSNLGPIYGDPSTRPIIITNWTKAKFWDAVDFSPAVLRPGKCGEARSALPGRMAIHYIQPTNVEKIRLDSVSIIGKDPRGNYWINGLLLPGVWPKIEEYISRAEKQHKAEKQ